MCQNFNREVCGGWFDGGYQVSINKRVNGKMVTLWKCPIFTSWKSMLYRVNKAPFGNNKKFLIYKDTEICQEWLTFSNFKVWWENNYVQGWFLDKDLKNPFKSEYSPSTCMFVPPRINCILTSGKRGSGLIGVYFNKQRKLYQAQCSVSDKGNRFIGMFDNELDGHFAWVATKYIELEIAIQNCTPQIGEVLEKWSGVLLYSLINRKGITNMTDFVRNNPDSWDYWMKPKGYKSVVLDQFLPKEN